MHLVWRNGRDIQLVGIFLSSPVILLSSRGANGAYDNLGATPLCKDLGSRGSLYVRSNTLDEDMALPNINTKGKYELWHSFPLSPPLEWCNDRTTPPLSYYVVFLNALLMLKKKNSARHTNKTRDRGLPSTTKRMENQQMGKQMRRRQQQQQQERDTGEHGGSEDRPTRPAQNLGSLSHPRRSRQATRDMGKKPKRARRLLYIG